MVRHVTRVEKEYVPNMGHECNDDKTISAFFLVPSLLACLLACFNLCQQITDKPTYIRKVPGTGPRITDLILVFANCHVASASKLLYTRGNVFCGC